MGGSQLNAIELAAAVRDLGNEVSVYGRPGVLGARIDELGLELIESPEPGRRPSLSVVSDLRARLADGRFDVVHGYEWPPALEARLACLGSRTACVATVMSMAVAPFIPRHVPLVVGTEQIGQVERSAGRRRVTVIEPPVDVTYNAPDVASPEGFRLAHLVPEGLHVVCVTRLAQELKLEGLLTAISVVPRLGPHVILTVVGDGPARNTVRTAADKANGEAGRRAVILTGPLDDPRPAYAMADVMLGMGGSALRAMAFAKPLVVQGESGFWCTLTPASLPQFRWTGWFGVGDGAGSGGDRLRGELLPLLASPDRRRQLGALSRQIVVDSFSLDAATPRQMDVYAAAVTQRAGQRFSPQEDGRAFAGIVQYKAARLAAHRRGRGTTDDFNATPVAVHRGPPGAGHTRARSSTNAKR